MWNDDDQTDWALLAAMIIVVVFVLICTGGCVSVGGASEWRPDQHVSVMRACRVVCHPLGVRKYDAIDGSCECAVRGDGPARGH